MGFDRVEDAIEDVEGAALIGPRILDLGAAVGFAQAAPVSYGSIVRPLTMGATAGGLFQSDRHPRQAGGGR